MVPGEKTMAGMKGAMQTLCVVKRLFPLIQSGEKRFTIRWREDRIQPGPLKYLCEGDAATSVIVRVTRCADMPLCEAAGFVGMAGEWTDDVMLQGMREHYPEIELSSIVQVIEHLPTPGVSKYRKRNS